MKIKQITLCALFVCLITVGAFIKIPAVPLPFTLQLPVVILCGMLSKGKTGLIASLVYILMGLMGLPVFSGGGGISYILQPSFGYIIGFPVAAFTVETICRKVKEPTLKRLFTAGFFAILIVYAAGFVYYCMICRFYLGTELDLKALFLNLCVLTLPKDVLMCILAAVVGKRLLPATDNIL